MSSTIGDALIVPLGQMGSQRAARPCLPRARPIGIALILALDQMSSQGAAAPRWPRARKHCFIVELRQDVKLDLELSRAGSRSIDSGRTLRASVL